MHSRRRRTKHLLSIVAHVLWLGDNSHLHRSNVWAIFNAFSGDNCLLGLGMHRCRAASRTRPLRRHVWLMGRGRAITLVEECAARRQCKQPPQRWLGGQTRAARSSRTCWCIACRVDDGFAGALSLSVTSTPCDDAVGRESERIMSSPLITAYQCTWSRQTQDIAIVDLDAEFGQAMVRGVIGVHFVPKRIRRVHTGRCLKLFLAIPFENHVLCTCVGTALALQSWKTR